MTNFAPLFKRESVMGNLLPTRGVLSHGSPAR